MLDNKFNQYRPEVCPEIEKQSNRDSNTIVRDPFVVFTPLTPYI